MNGEYVQADLTELEDFVKDLHNASAKFKEDIVVFLDAAGVDMLRIIQDEIIRLDVVDTRTGTGNRDQCRICRICE